MQDESSVEGKFEGASRFVEALFNSFRSYEKMGNELELIHKQRLRDKKRQEQSTAPEQQCKT